MREMDTILCFANFIIAHNVSIRFRQANRKRKKTQENASAQKIRKPRDHVHKLIATPRVPGEKQDDPRDAPYTHPRVSRRVAPR